MKQRNFPQSTDDVRFTAPFEAGRTAADEGGGFDSADRIPPDARPENTDSETPTPPDRQERISARAYERYLSRDAAGGTGNHVEDWLEAEQEIDGEDSGR